MIVTKRIAIRIALIVLAAVILQVSFLSFLSLLGAIPNLVPVVVVCLGLLGGAVVGGVGGFVAGLLVDSMLLQTLGVTSLVLLSIGYLAGRYRESFEIAGAFVVPLLAGGLTLLAAGGFAAIQLMLGIEAPVSVLAVREIAVQALLAVLLAIPAYPLVRRILAPGLIDYAPAHRLLIPGRRRARAAASPKRRRGAAGSPRHEARRRRRASRSRSAIRGGVG